MLINRDLRSMEFEDFEWRGVYDWSVLKHFSWNGVCIGLLLVGFRKGSCDV